MAYGVSNGHVTNDVTLGRQSAPMLGGPMLRRRRRRADETSDFIAPHLIMKIKQEIFAVARKPWAATLFPLAILA